MALKYHLVERRNMGATAATQPTLVYGQIRKSDSIEFDAVCAEGARCITQHAP
jgi:hypothetical protein